MCSIYRLSFLRLTETLLLRQLLFHLLNWNRERFHISPSILRLLKWRTTFWKSQDWESVTGQSGILQLTVFTGNVSVKVPSLNSHNYWDKKNRAFQILTKHPKKLLYFLQENFHISLIHFFNDSFYFNFLISPLNIK